MKWIDRLQQCLDYIEDNLKDEIDMDILAHKACMSKFYFYRMFLSITGIQINEYIRNRRMTLAACELAKSGSKVIDIAISYGYSSSEAFSRAFKAIHGVSPADVKNGSFNLKAYPPISFQMIIKGAVVMHYKIEKKEGFVVAGVKRRFNMQNSDNTNNVAKRWDDYNNQGIREKLAVFSKTKETYGICMSNNSQTDEFDYAIAVPYNGLPLSADFELIHIQTSTYAIFDNIKISEIEEYTKRIFNEWLPATEYELQDVPEIEFYPYSVIDNEEYTMQIWLPIK